ncbi:amidohydrolase family protein [Microbacterium sp. LWO14-1.2]|uniref:amidohydrolase n=1 Tax=unclassified Microbacterium TaxID=2609290 RepID=UPI0031399D60
MILTNAVILTSDDQSPAADTLVIRDGRFDWVGRASDLPRSIDLPVVDLDGRAVIPGLIDAHSHPALVAMSGWHVQLPETQSVDELIDFIREYGMAHPQEDEPYLYFEYFPTALLGEGGATKELLDRAISDRPVLVQDAGDHASWVNTRMLELLGVDDTTPDPVPGLERFARDAHGRPTGYIFENAHVRFLPRMYETLGWTPPEQPTPEIIRPVLDFLGSTGVVAVFDALIETPEVVAAMRELESRGDLHLHYEGAVRFRTLGDLPEALATVSALDDDSASSRVRVRTVKLFLDGTNELGSGAVLDPLLSEDNAGPLGAIQMELDDLAECMRLCNGAAVDLHIHMVGDRAFRTACDAVERARSRAEAEGDKWSLQVTFAHCELVDPADLARPAELGVIVNWTNHWSGGYFGEEAARHLGAHRWERMYDFTAIADSGARLTFSSDVVSAAELHRAAPFFGMQIAATRIDPEVPLDPERFAESRRPASTASLSIAQLLRGYTIDAAVQLRIEKDYGSVSPGKLANLVVLNIDPFATPAHELATVQPTAVVFSGAVVSGSLPSPR